MSAKYHITTTEAPPRFAPVSRLSALEIEGCLGCLVCVKRESCVYDVYRKRAFDAAQLVDTADVLCVRCMRCVQECKKGILSRVRNPAQTLCSLPEQDAPGYNRHGWVIKPNVAQWIDLPAFWDGLRLNISLLDGSTDSLQIFSPKLIQLLAVGTVLSMPRYR